MIRCIHRIWLFLGIVWREDWTDKRMSVATAWKVAGIITK